MMVGWLNHSLHRFFQDAPLKILQEDTKKSLAKRIATEHGYDWKEVYKFLKENPFILAHKGVAMVGIEVVSSKDVKDPLTFQQYATSIKNEAKPYFQGVIFIIILCAACL